MTAHVPITSTLLRRVVRCARGELSPLFQVQGPEARRERMFDLAALTWIEQLRFSPERLRDSIRRGDAISISGQAPTTPLAPEQAVRRILTLVRRAGLEEADAIGKYLFDAGTPAENQLPSAPFPDLPRTQAQVRSWMRTDTPGILPYESAPALLAAVHDAAHSGWKQRARERGLPEPVDLSRACKFSSAFVKALFGGTIEGNEHHQYNRIGGEIVDLNRDAADVREILDRGGNPHLHDPIFIGSRDHSASMLSCMPRVAAWLSEHTPAFTEALAAPESANATTRKRRP